MNDEFRMTNGEELNRSMVKSLNCGDRKARPGKHELCKWLIIKGRWALLGFVGPLVLNFFSEGPNREKYQGAVMGRKYLPVDAATKTLKLRNEPKSKTRESPDFIGSKWRFWR